ncbi:C4-dicarboxylate ABC transporter substrate-binding protein [Acuticoccus sediminis]|uniref:C4-dicarboxylate ABC transporter substrate-binding protein n=1 Tax=Acuticoccus sediminis TaxID=2184697 RepID=A0A8B2NH15_9HYPH|nr:TRAP transporter substrate-binding protein [Acuticoccus sediminis]RAH98421.1 C4-dicarboxylate ABC transporter substrate-binding protein [Acuticoccus sediminis]
MRATVIAASLAALLATPALAQDVTLRLAHFAAETHPGHIAAEQFAKNVAERTGGAVEIEIYPANELGSPPEQLEQTVLGAIDMNLPTQGGLDKYEKAFGTVMTPFAFKDYAQAHEVLDGPFNDWVAPKLEEQGLVLLSNWEYGFRNITNSKHPIETPDDVAGLKLRTPPELQIVAAVEGLGASATQIAFPELPNALNQGVVDGQENPVGVIYHYNLDDFQKYLALTRHVYNSMVHVINKDSWERLTPEQQAIVREESQKAGALMRELVAAQEEEELAKLEERGMEITRPDLAAFRQTVAGSEAMKRVTEYTGAENMEKFQSFLAD